LFVNDCVEEQEIEEEQEEEQTQEEEVVITPPVITQSDVLPPETSFKDSTAYTALLGLVVVMLIAGVVFLGAYYMNIRKR